MFAALRALFRMFTVVFALLALKSGGAQAQEWLYVEARQLPRDCTVPLSCVADGSLLTRSLLSVSNGQASAFARRVEAAAAMRDLPDVIGPSDLALMVPELAGLDIASRLEALANHPGVYFDSTKLDADDGSAAFSGFIRERLGAAGLRFLTEEEWKETPGRPVLSVGYTPWRDRAGCILPFSLSVQIKEEVVLVRRPEVKLTATVWAAYGRQDLTNKNFTVDNALTEVIGKLAKDIRAANS